MLDQIAEYLKNPSWRRQHRWRQAIWHLMNNLGLTGTHVLPISRRWVDIHRRPMVFKNLDPAFNGFKIVQISDLHYSPVVWARYLIQHLRWINDLKPDLVVITGDLITGGYAYAHRIATILSHLKSPHGVICTLGNHDYSMYGGNNSSEGNRRADYLAKCLRARGMIVLRNETHRLHLPGSATPLVIVGLDDEWSGHLDANKGFAGVEPAQPVICLNHNPVNVLELMPYPWEWMLSGHTHGRQVGSSRFGRTFYPKLYRHYTHGYYLVQGRHLYVNKGLSYGQRMLDWCRPEITVFKLRPPGSLTEGERRADTE